MLESMDKWLTAIADDDSARDKQAKVLANMPTGLSDGCYLADGKRINEPLTYPASGPGAEGYPIGADPHLRAGEPLAESTLKYAWKPVDFNAYRIRFTAAEK